MNHSTTAWKPLFSVMKFYTLRHEFAPSVMSPIVCSVMKYKSRHENFLRHESLTTSWTHFFSVMKFCSLRHEFAPSVMSPIVWSVMKYNFRHEKNFRHESLTTSWTHFFPSWNVVPSVMNSYISSSVYLIQPPRVGLMDSWVHPSCTFSLTKHCTRVHRHNMKAYRDFNCLFSLDYKRNSLLYSTSSHPWA